MSLRRKRRMPINIRDHGQIDSTYIYIAFDLINKLARIKKNRINRRSTYESSKSTYETARQMTIGATHRSSIGATHRDLGWPLLLRWRGSTNTKPGWLVCFR